MAGLFRAREIFEVGGFLNHWFDNRISKNKNCLICFTGSTGSGKSWSCLGGAESWYKYYFNESYNVDNVCFSIGELAKRINNLHKEGKLRKGDCFILEEAGANFGNLDFQNKLSKMFNYILQSFRSMNLVLFINLPVLTMLNKAARQLTHGNFVTSGIDYETEQTIVKPLLHQLSQQTGKSYWKYPRVKKNGKVVTLHRIKFNKPSSELVTAYEIKKQEFVFTLTQELVNEVEKDEKEKLYEIAKKRKGLSERELQIIDLMKEGLSKQQVADKIGCSLNNIDSRLSNAWKKGYDWKKFISENANREPPDRVRSPTPIT